MHEPAAREGAEAGAVAEGISAIRPPVATRGLHPEGGEGYGSVLGPRTPESQPRERGWGVRTEISPGAGDMGWVSRGKINQRGLKAPVRGAVPISLKTLGSRSAWT